jgi:hypothetical protein
VSIQDLQQNPQDTSNFYLANMYQATINPNSSSSLPTSPPPFTPPNYAVWVNSLWFLSLAISLTCALLATFLQQWARRYLKVTHSRYSPHKRARIRAFFAEGVEKCLLPWAVETLPTLLHISLFLFFAGLVVFLWNVNLTIFKLVLLWVAVCTALYGCFTLMPIFRHDSPYYTSMSSSLWPLVYVLAWFVSLLSGALLYFTCWGRGGEWLIKLAERCGGSLSQGMQKTVEITALNSPPEIDTRAFMWTFDCLDEDHELERFFSGLPGLRGSKVVDDPLPRLTFEQQCELNNELIGLIDRTFLSDLLPTPVKERRTLICAKAIDPVHTSNTFGILRRILSQCHYSGPMVPGIVQVMRGWGDDMKDISVAQATLCDIVAQAQQRDHSWFNLASDALDSPEAVLRDYAAHGNSLSLAILIHVVRQQFSLFRKLHWPYYEFSRVLEAASKFDVLDTSPELQHEFCALWNEVCASADWEIARHILSPIRNIYLTLHLHTDSVPTAFSADTGDNDQILWQPSVYPSCNVPDHQLHSTPLIHDIAAPTAIVHGVPRNDALLVPTSLTTAPAAPSPSIHAPILIDEHTMDMPLLDSDMSAPVPFHPAHQMTTESVRASSTSPDPAGASAALNNPSAQTMSLTTRETLMSTSSVVPPAPLSPQHIADLLVHPDEPEVPSSAFPEPVLDDSTGPSSLTTHFLSQYLIARYWLQFLQILHQSPLLHRSWILLKAPAQKLVCVRTRALSIPLQ